VEWQIYIKKEGFCVSDSDSHDSSENKGHNLKF